MTIKKKSGIHQFEKGDILKKGSYVGVVEKVKFTHLHKHPYIKLQGIVRSCGEIYTESRRFYSAEGLKKIGVLEW